MYHNITYKSSRLARIIRNCMDIPGRELFHDVDENGDVHVIDSGEINDYIHEISGGEFTSKNFRTWHGTVKCIAALKELGEFETDKEAKQKIVEALDIVATQLGNTRSVCKKHYVHPCILAAYEDHFLTTLFATHEERP